MQTGVTSNNHAVNCTPNVYEFSEPTGSETFVRKQNDPAIARTFFPIACCM